MNERVQTDVPQQHPRCWRACSLHSSVHGDGDLRMTRGCERDDRTCPTTASLDASPTTWSIQYETRPGRFSGTRTNSSCERCTQPAFPESNVSEAWRYLYSSSAQPMNSAVASLGWINRGIRGNSQPGDAVGQGVPTGPPTTSANKTQESPLRGPRTPQSKSGSAHLRDHQRCGAKLNSATYGRPTARTLLSGAHQAVLERQRVVIRLGGVRLPSPRVGSRALEKRALRLHVRGPAQYQGIHPPQHSARHGRRVLRFAFSLTCTGEKNGNGTRVTSPAATYGASTACKSASIPHRS
jgi:hypothetical protein